MRRSAKPRQDALAVATNNPARKPQTNGHYPGTPSNQIGIVRILVVALFSFIILAVTAMHLYLTKMEISDVNAQTNNAVSVQRVVRQRHGQKSTEQRNVQTLRAANQQSNADVGRQHTSHIPERAFGSKRGHILCDTEVDSYVSYWSDPRSQQDQLFQSPFSKAPIDLNQAQSTSDTTRYLSFEPDCGGWNNIRMEFEIMVVLAAATNRTLILPPDYPVYLLQKDKQSRHRGIQDFFQFDGDSNSSTNKGSGGFDEVVNVITMRDFFHKEILEKKSYPLPMDEANRTTVLSSTTKCNYKAKDKKSCIYLFDHMSTIADFVPLWNGEKHCLIMDDANWFKSSLDTMTQSTDQRQKILDFCADRTPVYYNRHLHDSRLIHFRSHEKDTRLLVHFYAFLYFTNPKIGNYYKRLVRDRVRYSDPIHCAAGKVVKSLLEEFGSYSSMHIRRGDFQWPKMRISAEEWLKNTLHIFQENEVIYICTDETDMSFFDPLRSRYRLKLLSDYSELAGLSSLDPNFIGMIDVVIASRGRQFVGTYFSSFSAFIGRLRGYHGMSGTSMHYGYLGRMNETHSWMTPHSSYSAREFPTGWLAIDGDAEPSEMDFF